MSKPASAILPVILTLLLLTGSPGQAAQEREADQSVKLGIGSSLEESVQPRKPARHHRNHRQHVDLA